MPSPLAISGGTVPEVGFAGGLAFLDGSSDPPASAAIVGFVGAVRIVASVDARL